MSGNPDPGDDLGLDAGRVTSVATSRRALQTAATLVSVSLFFSFPPFWAVLALPDGRTFKANCLGPREYLRDLLMRREDVIDTWGTVAYFRLTPDGVPRFPRLKAVEVPEPALEPEIADGPK